MAKFSCFQDELFLVFLSSDQSEELTVERSLSLLQQKALSVSSLLSQLLQQLLSQRRAFCTCSVRSSCCIREQLGNVYNDPSWISGLPLGRFSLFLLFRLRLLMQIPYAVRCDGILGRNFYVLVINFISSSLSYTLTA